MIILLFLFHFRASSDQSAQGAELGKDVELSWGVGALRLWLSSSFDEAVGLGQQAPC